MENYNCLASYLEDYEDPSKGCNSTVGIDNSQSFDHETSALNQVFLGESNGMSLSSCMCVEGPRAEK